MITVEGIVDIVGVLACFQVFSQIALHLYLRLPTTRILVLGCLWLLLNLGRVLDGDALGHLFDRIEGGLLLHVALVERPIVQFYVRLAVLQVVKVALPL
jgi:hypothetical protein